MRSRGRLHEAESAVNEFRFELRSELRQLAAEGRLESSVVDLLRTGLTSLRREVIGAARNGS
ncbi:hypothetical protein GCM10025881_21490 [Pseudolysinimonas kribbensis]|uniref:Uncharacterized protein n=2 Tax=Pseudolysinimonas kribbensis TaxID=433641 RepID=A0ABQ6K3W7_9MICO|nr:hypothetical protein GCM10025881_21490 [Pseudolysinimonas kribbensis]